MGQAPFLGLQNIRTEGFIFPPSITDVIITAPKHPYHEDSTQTQNSASKYWQIPQWQEASKIQQNPTRTTGNLATGRESLCCVCKWNV
jgi:hypothetical protein